MYLAPEGYRINIVENKGLFWELTPNLIKELGLKKRQRITLHFGSLSILLRVKKIRAKKVADNIRMRLSRDTINKLHIPENISLSVKQIDNKHFRLGPVIGILTFANTMNSKSFGFYLNYVRWITDGLIYVFGSRSLDTGKETISGYYYDTDTKKWLPGEFPYPDAVMDRCYPNPYNAHSCLEKVIGKGKIFNKKTMINKFEFYAALHENELVNSNLPETGMFHKISDLKYFINKYREIFLKPINGMKGRGIVNVSFEKVGLICRYMDNNVLKTKKLTNTEEIFTLLTERGGNREYIIQNAVHRMKYNGRPFSFRVIVYKDGSGEWKVPAIFAKAALGDSFLTNFNSGAKFILLKDLFKHIGRHLPCSKNDFLGSLTELSLNAANALDTAYGPLGKLGLDIVIDTAGKPWLIEANGNPGLIPWHVQSEFPDWRHQVFQFPLSYAIHLAGFN